MKKAVAALAALIVFSTWGCSSKLDSAQETAAIDAAATWLAILDSGDYEGSWVSAATFLKSSVSKEDWIRAMENARKPLGALVSRKISETKHRTLLPKALKGQYLIIEYDTDFANRSSAGESITQMQEKDGTWHVGGYHLN